jgi:hypothetical protein
LRKGVEKRRGRKLTRRREGVAGSDDRRADESGLLLGPYAKPGVKAA